MGLTKTDNLIWKREFGVLLKRFFDQYDLDYELFAKQYSWSTSTVRYWFYGRSLPRDGLVNIKAFFMENLKGNQQHDVIIYEEIKDFFESQGLNKVYYTLRRCYPSMNVFSGEVLASCYSYAKNNYSSAHILGTEIPETGKTQVVVFDFDGTLTSGNANRTTWEQIWISLGYDVKCCQDLHMRFNRGEITHSEWCKLTEECFKERNLHRKTVEKVASKVHLLKGVRQTFKELNHRGIKIYIVSGSIMLVIRSVLGAIYQYVDGIKANEFRFDNESGILLEIIGTKYDFEGKAYYISEIAEELRISPHDILFVGNSINDQSAYMSGARTLCINPKVTDILNQTVWNNCIPSCDNLWDIMKYI